MVMRALLVAFLLPFVTLSAQQVSVRAEVQQRTLTADAPIDVTITISRPPGMEVDSESFLYGRQPLPALHVGDASHTSISVINGRRRDDSKIVSTYRMRLPPMGEGVHLLQPISVKVDGKTYSTHAHSVSIEKGEEGADFKLLAEIDGPNPLYLGQRIRVIYRIAFKDDVELTTEQLPLFDIKGFRAVGDKQFAAKVEGGYNIHEIAQEFEAEETGIQQIPQSVIEGFAYIRTLFGRKRYLEPKLRAVAPPMEIAVAPFPQQEKPDSFAGAVGRYTLSAERVGQGVVRVGDKVVIRIMMKGGQPHLVQLPALERQSPFRGRFRVSDLPPVRQERDDLAFFDLELRPLSADIEEIPPVEWSYFDSESRRYRTLFTDPIPLQVVEAPQLEEPSRPMVRQEETETLQEEEAVVSWDSLDQVSALEVGRVYRIEESDLIQHWWETAWALLLLPAGVGIVVGQLMLRRFLQERRVERDESAEDLLRKAGVHCDDGALALPLVERALLLRLLERGEVSSAESISQLPEEGSTGRVKAFLQHLEERRFTGQILDAREMKELVKEAKKIFGEI